MGTIGIRKDYLEEKALNAYPDISYPCDKPSIYEDPRFHKPKEKPTLKVTVNLLMTMRKPLENTILSV